MKKSHTASYAERELNILIKTVEDPIVAPFKKEIIALCDRFGKSGQSGGSAPFTATALATAIKKLCLKQPICDITGVDDEWVDVTKYSCGEVLYQNNRCSSVFKKGDGECYYVGAIVFKGNNGSCFTSNGSVKLYDGTIVRSSCGIKKFPFKPKVFYIDVISTEVKKDWWEHTIKNPKQLNSVYKYYKPM